MNNCDNSFTTHQPRTVNDSGNGTMNHFWDANGNLSQMVDCKTGSASINFWDEENRLRLAVNPKFAGYYAYDADGERVYKLTGSTQYNDLNGSNPSFGIIIDGITLYPSPYIVLTEKQYTKHYYIGSEKIATMIGDGGIVLETNHLSNEQRSLIKDGFYRTFEPTAFQYDKTPNIDIQGMHTYQLEYKCGCIEQVDLYLISVNSMLEPMMTMWQNSNGCKNEIYYTHSNHLGSASWITDVKGNPIQYIHYAPYGELIANQQTIGYDERYKFTGKERDWETGYDYFGARFYDHRKGFWNSVDPLADKYPNVTPYLYCNGNPIMLVDPDGKDWYEAEDGSAVLWKNSNDASINIDGVTYNNIGENYNHIVGNTTYGYHQNELQSIAYSTNTEFRQQTTSTSCKTTCEEMVRSSGFTPEAGRTGEILMATHDANGVVNAPSSEKVLKQGLCRLEDYLTNGMPCIIGVDYKAEQKHNLAPNGDGMTDHFVTIVGMTYNVQNGTTTYNFYDPGSVRGASLNNIITFNGQYLIGLTAARYSPFKVTTIRKNK